MIGSFLLWYILVSLAGVAMLPLASRVFARLTDRGYVFARSLGLLLWGYLFWLLASLGVLQNDAGGTLLALVLVVCASIYSLWKTGFSELREWFRRSKGFVIVTEVLFFLLFAGWALVRAGDPSATGTEKPMELAFINAILRSSVFPPHDPWLSGYAISYYYFGYVMVAMLARLAGTPGAVAFNLASALWFSLSALGAYGILFNLISGLRKSHADRPSRLTSALWSLLAPLFLLFVSNLEGFLEMLHARGIFWKPGREGTLVSSFWSWLDIQELVNPPAQPFSWIPQRPGGIWWWRASRVLQDYDLAGTSKEIIDEFPFFSYLLADLHPHVLAMPFVLLAIGLALNLYYRTRENVVSDRGFFAAAETWFKTGRFLWPPAAPGGFLWKTEFWIAALVLGGLSFLNTWDFPIYVGLYCAVYVFVRFREAGWSRRRIGEFFEFLVMFALTGILLYLPFYLGFASQAGGIIPSMNFFTRGSHFWVMFGPLLLPITGWMVWLWRKNPGANLKQGLVIATMVLLGLGVISYFLGFVTLNMSALGNLLLMSAPSGILARLGNAMMAAGGQFFALQGASDPSMIFFESLKRRLLYPGTWITLLVLLALVWSLLAALGKKEAPEDDRPHPDEESKEIEAANPNGFVLLLVLVGIGLALAPEYIYLRDQFGWRMNTIFKFYFQTWILWAVAAAYASVVLWKNLRKLWLPAFALCWSLIVIMSLAYPVFGLRMKSYAILSGNLSLDGASFLERYSPEDMKAINWLKTAPAGVVAEAVGGSYSGFARVSTHSGLPTVLGWPGHESQWRGGAAEMGSREEDIRTLYRTADWNEAKTILERYNIRYIFVGDQERNAYRVNENKFQGNVEPVFTSNSVVIYENIDYRPDKER